MKKSIDKPKPIMSLSTLINFVLEKCQDGRYLFRGQREDKPLLPKIARDGRNSMGEQLLKIESQMLEEFKRQCWPYLTINPLNEWDWLALAQHHGMATRVLDWTENPLAALWFAVRKPPGDSKEGIIWVLKVTKFGVAKINIEDPYKCAITKIFRPNHITPKLVAQTGWFTVHRYQSKEKCFIPLEKNKNYILYLRKLRISPDAFGELRVQLNQVGINNAVMFPEMAGLCTHIEWLNLSDDNKNLASRMLTEDGRMYVVRPARKTNLKDTGPKGD